MADPPRPLVTADTPLRDLRGLQAQLAGRAGIFPDAKTALEAVTALIEIRVKIEGGDHDTGRI